MIKSSKDIDRLISCTRGRQQTPKTNVEQRKGALEMVNENNSYKARLGVRWFRAKSGNTYLCPIDAFDGIENLSEDQLERMCVNESHDPHNN